METVIQVRHAMAANWKRGGTFVYCTYCLKRGRTLRWYRRHWVRAHCRPEAVRGTVSAGDYILETPDFDWGSVTPTRPTRIEYPS